MFLNLNLDFNPTPYLHVLSTLDYPQEERSDNSGNTQYDKDSRLQFFLIIIVNSEKLLLGVIIVKHAVIMMQ